MTIDIANERARVVEEAASWIDTPFHHGQCVKGIGVDCAQLLIGVYVQGCQLVPRPAVPEYSANWFLHERDSKLLSVISLSCVGRDLFHGDPEPGDIVVFHFGRTIAHAGIVTEWPEIIHAERMVQRVVRERIDVGEALRTRWSSCWMLARWAAVTVEGACRA